MAAQDPPVPTVTVLGTVLVDAMEREMEMGRGAVAAVEAEEGEAVAAEAALVEWAGLAVLGARDLPAQMATAPGTVLEAAMETEAGTEMDAEEEIITGEGEAAAVVEELEVSEV